MKSISKLANSVAGAASALSSIMLFLMMAVMFIDVVGRQFLNRPLSSATEIVEICMMCIVFLMLPLISYRREHVCIDLLDSFFTRRMFQMQAFLTAAIGGVLFGLISYRLWAASARAFSQGEMTATLEIPLGYIFAMLCFFCTITALAFLASAFVPIDHEPASDEAGI